MVAIVAPLSFGSLTGKELPIRADQHYVHVNNIPEGHSTNRRKRNKDVQSWDHQVAYKYANCLIE